MMRCLQDNDDSQTIILKVQESYFYPHQGGYLTAGIFPAVQKITRKVLNGFEKMYLEMLIIGQFDL